MSPISHVFVACFVSSTITLAVYDSVKEHERNKTQERLKVDYAVCVDKAICIAKPEKGDVALQCKADVIKRCVEHVYQGKP